MKALLICTTVLVLHFSAEAQCPSGQVQGTAGACCWAGQTFVPEEGRCVGLPQCPTGLVGEGGTCVVQQNTATPPTSSLPDAWPETDGPPSNAINLRRDRVINGQLVWGGVALTVAVYGLKIPLYAGDPGVGGALGLVPVVGGLLGMIGHAANPDSNELYWLWYGGAAVIELTGLTLFIVGLVVGKEGLVYDEVALHEGERIRVGVTFSAPGAISGGSLRLRF